MATTIENTVGTATRDYSTLISAEAAIPADIVASDEIWRFTCYKDSVLTDFNWHIEGITSDATRYVEFTVAEADRHTGTRGTGFILRSTGGAAGDHGVNVVNVNVRIFYFEFDGVNIATNTDCIASSGVVTAGTEHYFGNNLIYDNDANSTCDGIVSWSTISGSNFHVYIYGNIVLGCGGNGISMGNSQNTRIYNNTVLNNNTTDTANRWGISGQNSATLTYKNNISMDNGDTNKIDIHTNADVTSNNVTSDATGEIINKAAADQFVSATPGSEDVHLLTGADAKNTGVVIATLGITPDVLTDADGELRG